MATVIAAAGYRVVASDLVAYDNAVFPVTPHVDALQAPLPPGVRTIVTSPPYAKLLLPRLVRHWLGILNPVGGQLCLLLRVLWGESKGGQALTTLHPAYSGKVKTPPRILWYEGTPQGFNANAVRRLGRDPRMQGVRSAAHHSRAAAGTPWSARRAAG